MRADGSGVTKKTMESKRAILTLRCSLALLPLAGATYLLTMFRTSGFGPDNSSFWVPLGVAFVYAGIPAALPFLDYRGEPSRQEPWESVWSRSQFQRPFAVVKKCR